MARHASPRGRAPVTATAGGCTVRRADRLRRCAVGTPSSTSGTSRHRAPRCLATAPTRSRRSRRASTSAAACWTDVTSPATASWSRSTTIGSTARPTTAARSGAHDRRGRARQRASFRGDDGSFPFRGHGVRVPRLEQILEQFPDARLVIDPKTDHGVAPLAALLPSLRSWERVYVARSPTSPLAQIRRLGAAAPARRSARGDRDRAGGQREWPPPAARCRLPPDPDPPRPRPRS